MSLLVLALCGRSDGPRLAALEGVCGLDGQALRVVERGEIAAVLQPWRPRTQGVGVEALRFAQGLVMRLHEAATIVPVRLGEVMKDEEEVGRFLAARAPYVERLLETFEGCDEWSVRLTAGGKPTDDVPPPPLTGAEEAASGAAYLKRRKQAFDERDGVPPELVTLCRGALQPIVELGRLARLEGPRPTMPMPSVHLLIRRDDRLALERAVERVLRGGGPRFVLTGPWPAYSFATPDAA